MLKTTSVLSLSALHVFLKAWIFMGAFLALMAYASHEPLTAKVCLGIAIASALGVLVLGRKLRNYR